MAIDFSKIEMDSLYELYKMTSLTQSWYYTSADHSIEYSGNTYLPAAIKRDSLEKSGDLNNEKMKITFPITDFFKRFIIIAPVYETSITIYLYQDESSVMKIFSGKITDVSLEQNTNACVITFDEQDALNTKLPRTIIEPACNHSLWSNGCGINREDFHAEFEVIEITPQYLNCLDVDFEADYFTQGVVKFNNDERWITKHYGNFFHIQYPFYDLKVGDTIVCYPGCDKTAATCKNKFDNLPHYLGMPYVPRKNPVIYGI